MRWGYPSSTGWAPCEGAGRWARRSVTWWRWATCRRPGRAASPRWCCAATPSASTGWSEMATNALPPLPATFASTRDALHRLAVYVVSPAQRMANGEIILRAATAGFATFEFDGHRIAVSGDRLVVDGLAHPITTLRAAAQAVG